MCAHVHGRYTCRQIIKHTYMHIDQNTESQTWTHTHKYINNKDITSVPSNTTLTHNTLAQIDTHTHTPRAHAQYTHKYTHARHTHAHNKHVLTNIKLLHNWYTLIPHAPFIHNTYTHSDVHNANNPHYHSQSPV